MIKPELSKLKKGQKDHYTLSSSLQSIKQHPAPRPDGSMMESIKAELDKFQTELDLQDINPDESIYSNSVRTGPHNMSTKSETNRNKRCNKIEPKKRGRETRSNLIRCWRVSSATTLKNESLGLQTSEMKVWVTSLPRTRRSIRTQALKCPSVNSSTR